MAFRTTNRWQVERRFSPSFDATWLPVLPDELPYRKEFQKLSSGGFALLLHGTFFYFLLNGLLTPNADDPIASQTSETPAITMMELSDMSDEEIAEPETADGAGQLQQASATPSELNASIETELPPEWSKSRIAVPRVVVEAPPLEIAAATTRQSNRNIGGQTGGGVYDPFAGAAPNRKSGLEEQTRPAPKPTLAGRISGFFGFGDEAEADQDAFEIWVASLRKRLPRAKGSVELSVTLGKDGRVIAGQIIGGSASQQVKFFVRNAIVGERFSELKKRGSREDYVRVPLITLG